MTDLQQDESAGWVVYIVRCADGTLYTGIARDVQRRIEEHNGALANGVDRGARYTRSRRPVALVYEEPAATRSAAARRENAIKRLTRSGKEDLLRGSPVLEA